MCHCPSRNQLTLTFEALRCGWWSFGYNYVLYFSLAIQLSIAHELRSKPHALRMSLQVTMRQHLLRRLSLLPCSSYSACPSNSTYFGGSTTTSCLFPISCQLLWWSSKLCNSLPKIKQLQLQFSLKFKFTVALAPPAVKPVHVEPVQGITQNASDLSSTQRLANLDKELTVFGQERK